MSGILLRCPNCGTTRASPGECEACHEAAVRYYCTNHTPGLWLDTGACPQCGARWGSPDTARGTGGRSPVGRSIPPRAAPATPAAAPSRPRSRPPTASVPDRGRRADEPRASVRRGEGPPPSPDRGPVRTPGSRGEHRPPADMGDSPGEPPVRITSWQDMLEAMMAGSRAPRRGRPPLTPSSDHPGSYRGERPRSGLGGCLVRLVMFALFLALVTVGGLVAFGASMLQMFRIW